MQMIAFTFSRRVFCIRQRNNQVHLIRTWTIRLCTMVITFVFLYLYLYLYFLSCLWGRNQLHLIRTCNNKTLHQGDYICIFTPIILSGTWQLWGKGIAISHALARFCSQNCPKIRPKTLFVSYIWPIMAQIIAPAVLWPNPITSP